MPYDAILFSWLATERLSYCHGTGGQNDCFHTWSYFPVGGLLPRRGVSTGLSMCRRWSSPSCRLVVIEIKQLWIIWLDLYICPNALLSINVYYTIQTKHTVVLQSPFFVINVLAPGEASDLIAISGARRFRPEYFLYLWAKEMIENLPGGLCGCSLLESRESGCQRRKRGGRLGR